MLEAQTEALRGVLENRTAALTSTLEKLTQVLDKQTQLLELTAEDLGAIRKSLD